MDFLQNLTTSTPRAFEIFFAVWREAWFVLVPAVLTYMLFWYWTEYMSGEFIRNIRWVNLAISVPPENEQSPKVMEEFFNAVHSIQKTPNFLDKLWKGQIQELLSLEIVGIDGNVRFIVRAPDYFKDLVDAHLYAEFPEVEIQEVDDYAQAIPDDFKKAGWDLFGAEMVLTNDDFYPIRTYPNFEHQMTQRIIDPIATIAEVMNKLKVGEQIWLQITIRPVMTKWPEKGKKFVEGLMGKEVKEPTPAILEALSKAGEITASPLVGGEAAEANEAFPAAAFLMAPGQRKVVENVERNIAKLAFEFKGRVIYIGRKEIFHKPRFNAIIGAFKQFNSYDMNGFKPYKRTFTKVDYFFKDIRVGWRQRKLLKGYKFRSWVIGAGPKILTSESLASIFHVPDITVKAPRLPRTLAKKGSAPANLPISR